MTSARKPSPRRPLLGLAVSYALGTWLGLRDVAPAVSGVAWLLALGAWWGSRRLAHWRRRTEPLTVWATHALVLCTATLCATGALRRHRGDLATLQEALDSGETVTVVGTVATEPSGELLQHGGARLRFSLRVVEIPDDFGGLRPKALRLPVEYYGPASMLGGNPARPVPRAGQGLQLQGRLRDATRDPAIPRYVLAVRPGGSEWHPALDSTGWTAAAWRVRHHAAETLSAGIEHADRAVAVLQAMVIGLRGDMPPETRKLFAASGTVHIFAISGLHVGILASLLTAVLPFTRLARPHWLWLLGPLLVAYTYLTGGSPSAVRACVMALLYLSAPLLDRRPDALSALAAAAILQLASSPFQLADLGFLFSFACVAGLLVLAPLLFHAWLPPEQEPDAGLDALAEVARLAARQGQEPAVPSGPRGFWRRLGRRLRRTVTGSLAVSVAAWLASAPLTALYFGRVTPVAILGNLFAIPLATAIVLCGSLSLVGGLLSPWISITFNCAALALIEWLCGLTGLVVRLPGAHGAMAPWPRWGVLLWYIACAGLGLHLLRRTSPRTISAAGASSVAGADVARDP